MKENQFMVNILMLFHYTDLEFTAGEGPEWISQLMSEYDSLVEADLVDKIVAEIGSDYQDTVQVIEDYFRDKLQKNAALRFFNADTYRGFGGAVLIVNSGICQIFQPLQQGFCICRV